MNKNQENEEMTSANDRKTLPLDRAGGKKKPYNAPTFVMLGSVEMLTNVSVIVE